MDSSRKRILIYSHDAYGLGNIRRNLAICEHLSKTIPNVSILILTGSPMIHAFRIPKHVDYVKLPCLTRDDRETFSTKYLDMQFKDALSFRSEVILATVKSFDPDLVLVDKKPVGLKKEFFPALTWLKVNKPETRLVLGLRDILDEPESTISVWRKNQYFEMIQQFYDDVWIFGDRRVYNAVEAYRMPKAVARKVTFTGYLGRDYSAMSRLTSRAQLGLNGHPFSLVTAGGGGDGYSIMKNYVEACLANSGSKKIDSMMLTGPEMPLAQRKEIARLSHEAPSVRCGEFSDRIETYLMASDVVVAMGGYNTMTEILSMGKKAVIVPRIKPVREQFIRAQRLDALGVIKMVHPEKLSPETLWQAVQEMSARTDIDRRIEQTVDLSGLATIERLVNQYFFEMREDATVFSNSEIEDFADEYDYA